MRSTPLFLGALCASVLPLGCGERAAPGEWDGMELLAIEGATVFTSPWVDPIEDGIVLIVNGVIEAVGPSGGVPIPQAAVRINGRGLSLMSGFWNADVRADPELLATALFGSTEELQGLLQDRFSRFGFTSVVETGTPRETLLPLIDRIESGEVTGPRIISTFGTTVGGVRWPSPSELLTEDPGLVPAGVEGAAVVPSLSRLQEELLRAPPTTVLGPTVRLGGALERLRVFAIDGGVLIFGTGAGYVESFDPITDHLLLEEAGIPFAVRLAALTTQPAVRFGFLYLGEVEPGMVADLVLIEGDPELDGTAFGQVRVVLREGRPLFVQ